MMNSKRLLVVDDDKIHRIIYATIARKMDYEVDLASTVEEARTALRARAYDCVVLDLFLDDEWGRDVLDVLADFETKPMVVLVSGAEESVLAEAVRHGGSLGLKMLPPLRKPVNMTAIRDMLHGVDVAGQADNLRAPPAA